MARIRVVKYRNVSKKNQPKVAYFHSKNFDEAIERTPVKKSTGKKNTIVALNDDQAKKYVRKTGNRLNKRVKRFHT